jgi:hypothetical protein
VPNRHRSSRSSPTARQSLCPCRRRGAAERAATRHRCKLVVGAAPARGPVEMRNRRHRFIS